MFRQNDTIGPYTLIKQLGRGAFGVVWLAERRGMIATTQVALKITVDEEPDIEALKVEAEVWARAGGHPNILPIIEADIYDNHLIIVSEYAPDGSLSGWLKQHGGAAPSIPAAVNMITGVLNGLKHLHSRKIIHRDLKPANILLQGDTPRLADFGIARVLKTGLHSGVAAGTPAFMAPEAFRGARNEQTDLWSAGVMFYQLVSGQVPFNNSDITSLCLSISNDPLPPLPATVPRPIQKIIINSLEKFPEHRYASAAAMLDALQRVNNLATYEIEGNTFNNITPPLSDQATSTAATLIKRSYQERGLVQPGKTPLAKATAPQRIGDTPIHCPVCQQTDSYDPSTSTCLRCSNSATRTDNNNRLAVPGNTYRAGVGFGEMTRNNQLATRQIDQFESADNRSFWRALSDGLMHHTGSKSLPEVSAKIVFLGTLFVSFVFNLYEYVTVWDAIFATMWYSFYAAAFALVAALITGILVMAADAAKWMKKRD